MSPYQRTIIGSLIITIILAVMLIMYQSAQPYLCFSGHLREAIALNRLRKPYYSKLSNGASEQVSDTLIGHETSSLIPAFFIDIKALWYREPAANIICGDFVSMTGAAAASNQLIRNNVAPPRDISLVQSLLQATKHDVLSNIEKSEFSNAVGAVDAALNELDRIENETASSFCMSRHLLESTGLATHHAQTYHNNTNGRTDGLMKTFISIQVQSLDSFGVDLDTEAQKLHARNIGIVCNDLPSIPF